MKKVIIYFLLLNLFNTVFFVGENLDDTPYNGIEEVDEEEYNSVVELVMEGYMGVADETPEDEDDDIPDIYKPQVDNYSIVTFEYKLITFSKPNPLVFFIFFRPYSCILKKDSPPPKFA